MSSIYAREFHILTTAGGWSAGDAMEFLSAATAAGGENKTPPNKTTVYSRSRAVESDRPAQPQRGMK